MGTDNRDLQPDITEWETLGHSALNGISPSNSSPLSSGNPAEKEKESVRPKQTRPSKGTWAKLIWTHRDKSRMHSSVPGPQWLCYGFQFSVFMGFLSIWVSGWVSDSCVLSWAPFLLMVYLVWLWCNRFCLIIFYFVTVFLNEWMNEWIGKTLNRSMNMICIELKIKFAFIIRRGYTPSYNYFGITHRRTRHESQTSSPALENQSEAGSTARICNNHK